MPALTNPRHERFVLELAAGKSADEAYQLAGFKANRGNATTLKAKQSISKRLAELQERAARRTEITIERLTEMLLEDRSFAREQGQAGAAVNATEKLGKLHGLFIERAETTNTSYVVSGEPIDDVEQWAEQYAPKH